MKRSWLATVGAVVLVLLRFVPSAHAQQPKKIPLIGILSDVTPVLAAKLYEPPFARDARARSWPPG